MTTPSPPSPLSNSVCGRLGEVFLEIKIVPLVDCCNNIIPLVSTGENVCCLKASLSSCTVALSRININTGPHQRKPTSSSSQSQSNISGSSSCYCRQPYIFFSYILFIRNYKAILDEIYVIVYVWEYQNIGGEENNLAALFINPHCLVQYNKYKNTISPPKYNNQ